MRRASIQAGRVLPLLIAALLLCGQPAYSQERGGETEKVKPVTLRVGVPNKQSEREVVFPLVVETSGTAAVGRIRAELELSAMQGWVFRSLDPARGLDLRSQVRKRNEAPDKLIIEWDVSAEGKELPTGHVALVRMLADKGKGKSEAPASDNPPTLVLRKMSWGLAEFERPQENLPQLNTPDNITGNPDVSCFFFTH